jgi:OOP family OmpA-OmpF porin
MKKSLLGLMLASTMTVGTTAQAADMYDGSWYLLPGASYFNPDSETDADNGAGGFLKIGKEISQHWDLQGGLSYNKADEDFSGAGYTGDYKQTALNLDALYMFSRSKFRPFLLAGMGIARNDLDYKLNGAQIGDENTSWLANVGLGAQMLFTDSFGIQADLRHQWSEVDTTGRDDETVGNTLFNLGGIFRFGAPKAAPVIAAAPVMVEDSTLPAIAPRDEYVPEPLNIVESCAPSMETITVSAEELFGFDRAKLKSDGEIKLNDVASKINANPEIALVMVVGHTDRIGSAAYNQRLSERRANMVAQYLVSQGVDPSRLQALGRGETEPVVECSGIRGKALIECLQPNRRVEITAQMTKEVGCE